MYSDGFHFETRLVGLRLPVHVTATLDEGPDHACDVVLVVVVLVEEELENWLVVGLELLLLMEYCYPENEIVGVVEDHGDRHVQVSYPPW